MNIINYNINMALTDKQIRDEFVFRVSKLYIEKQITEQEANELLFYGLYNNEWNNVPKLNSWKEVEEYTQKLYPYQGTLHK